jgi:hypothetical protein
MQREDVNLQLKNKDTRSTWKRATELLLLVFDAALFLVYKHCFVPEESMPCDSHTIILS